MKTIGLRTAWLPLGVLVSSLCWPGTGRTATANVTVGSNFFSPSSSTIDVNDSVLWTWSGNNHTTTSSSVPSLWNSGIHNSGFTFTRQFTTAGSFPYRCTQHAGQTGTITVRTPNTPPTVTITAPTQGEVFTAPAGFAFTATASDPGGSVTNVQFFRGTTSLGNDTTSPYSVAVSGLAAGGYSLSAVASDNGGARATNSVSITVEPSNTPPTVSITSPTEGSVFAEPATFMFTATASDPGGSVTNVQFFRGTTSLGNDTAVPYSVPVSGLAAGTHVLRAVATDDRGATNSSDAVTVSVVTPVPIVLSGMERPSSARFVFSYTANVGLRYEIQRSAGLSNGTVIRTDTANTDRMTVTDNEATNWLNFYQVRLLPNP